MHEFGIMTYLLEAVEAKAHELGAPRVLAINVVVGDRSSIVDDSLLYYFDMMTPGTLAEGARLNMTRVATKFYCACCDQKYTPGSDFACPNCTQVGVLTEAGSEFYIDSIEIERKEHDRTRGESCQEYSGWQ
ncbi:MAG: hydrogenase maturation nickel metallochaperone HypA [Anaerolineaceae bacterium]|nr:hydrogenase maturation nickel metallochaperone HypA [Anaerolineaceae bacterium]